MNGFATVRSLKFTPNREKEAEKRKGKKGKGGKQFALENMENVIFDQAFSIQSTSVLLGFL